MPLPFVKKPAQPERALCVMIVEDEALIALSLDDACEDEGHRAIGPFPTCAEGLAALAGSAPDVAILDATLKDGSCLELARGLRRRSIPFLIYSGRNAVEEHAPELVGIRWIDKPCAPELVVRAAVTLIEESAIHAGTRSNLSSTPPF